MSEIVDIGAAKTKLVATAPYPIARALLLRWPDRLTRAELHARVLSVLDAEIAEEVG